MQVRNKLRYKDANLRLRVSFPFDVINLDVFGVMFPPRKGIITPLLRSLLQILQWQTSQTLQPGNRPCDQFTLLLTSHLDPDLTDQDAIAQLTNRLDENLRSNQQFRDVITARYGFSTARQLADAYFAEFFCIALPKYILQYALFQLGWSVQNGPIYLYNRPDRYNSQKSYQIMHSVSVFQRVPDFSQRLDSPGVEQYMHEATKIATGGVTWVDELVGNLDIQSALESDLEEILAFRSQYAQRLG